MSQQPIKWFNPELVMSHNCVLNMVMSQRGLGKTYGFLKRATSRYLKTGSQFIYLRRTQEELKQTTGTLFDALVANGEIKKGEFRVIGKNIFHAVKEKDGERLDEAGFVLALSGAGKVKSVSFAAVDTIIFDEFIPEDGKYISQETRLFMSLMETVIRMNENARIIMLANSITQYSKYFELFNMKNTGKEFIRNKKASILIANIYSEKFYEQKAATAWGKIIEQTPFADYMLKNEPLLDKKDFLRLVRGKHKMALFNIIFPDGRKACVYYYSEEGIYWADNEANHTAPTYNCTDRLLEGTYNTNKIPEIKRRLKVWAVQASLFFRDMETKLAVEEFIYS